MKRDEGVRKESFKTYFIDGVQKGRDARQESALGHTVSSILARLGQQGIVILDHNRQVTGGRLDVISKRGDLFGLATVVLASAGERRIRRQGLRSVSTRRRRQQRFEQRHYWIIYN